MFKIIEFMYYHKLFGVHKKCWAQLVGNYYYKPYYNKYMDISECDLCEGSMYTYCGKKCGCDYDKDEFCHLHKDSRINHEKWQDYNDAAEEGQKVNWQQFEKMLEQGVV